MPLSTEQTSECKPSEAFIVQINQKLNKKSGCRKKIVNCYKKQKLFERNENERIICIWKTDSKQKCGGSLFSFRLFVETLNVFMTVHQTRNLNMKHRKHEVSGSRLTGKSVVSA